MTERRKIKIREEWKNEENWEEYTREGWRKKESENRRKD